ncbi:hypothetical protein [Candidatus Uabimicrobium sp. HlEnr_7]|uniref:hypothetical protein n=1 Tax=Candidatus Uabimicrobium helgolandensis TaxID=3095367 RepID=UPI003557AF2E
MKKAFTLIAILCVAFFANTLTAELKVLDNTKDFEKLIKESQVPVIVKFSAYW